MAAPVDSAHAEETGPWSEPLSDVVFKLHFRSVNYPFLFQLHFRIMPPVPVPVALPPHEQPSHVAGALPSRDVPVPVSPRSQPVPASPIGHRHTRVMPLVRPPVTREHGAFLYDYSSGSALVVAPPRTTATRLALGRVVHQKGSVVSPGGGGTSGEKRYRSGSPPSALILSTKQQPIPTYNIIKAVDTRCLHGSSEHNIGFPHPRRVWFYSNRCRVMQVCHVNTSLWSSWPKRTALRPYILHCRRWSNNAEPPMRQQ
eukprot:1182595-Amphidinium_carterae.1